MQPPVILVIPASDEAESIGAVLSEVRPELVGEVVVVVGSSADSTAAVAAAHGARIIAQSRPGYGAACLQGAREAAALGAEIVVFLDGDYADPPMELAQVMGPVLADEADLVLGCRSVSAHAGAGVCYVTAQGTALPRCIAPFTGGPYDSIVLGNYLRDGVQAVWTGEAYRAFRERLYSWDPPAACQNCGLSWSM